MRRGAPAEAPEAALVRDLARAYYDPLLRFATRLAGDPGEAADLVQDTFERALRHYDATASAANPRAWLYMILRNAFVDRCRRRVRTVSTDSFDLPDPTYEREGDAAPRWAAVSPDQFRAALEALPAEFRTVYRLHAIEGRAYREIAESLGIPENTVGTRLARARQKLKALLLEAAGQGEAVDA